MRGDEHALRVTPSLLDRLIDQQPKTPDTLPSRLQSVKDLRDAVRRDLEHLLNTRNAFADLPPAFTETSRSVIAYGIPDFSALNIASPRNQNRLRQMLETAIRTFEPRLTAVVVTLRAPDKIDRSLGLHVDARLQIDPAPEPIAFDIVVPLHTRECQVKDSD